MDDRDRPSGTYAEPADGESAAEVCEAGDKACVDPQVDTDDKALAAGSGQLNDMEDTENPPPSARTLPNVKKRGE